MSLFLERELINNLAVRGGYVHRVQQQYSGTINTNQPYEAFHIPDGHRRAHQAPEQPLVDAGVGLVHEGVGLPHAVQHLSGQPQQPDQCQC